MFCMKCGREIDENQVFCNSCLEDMLKYPVKPGIAIQLPSRNEPALLKKSLTRRRPAPSLEEQVRILKRRVRRWFVAWLVAALLFGAAAYPAYQYLRETFIVLPGQNYSTFTETETTQP